MTRSGKLAECQIAEIATLSVAILMKQLTPKLIEMMRDARVSGVSDANRMKALQGHVDSRIEREKVEMHWVLTRYEIGSNRSKKQFAERMRAELKLKSKTKTIRNWLSEFGQN